MSASGVAQVVNGRWSYTVPTPLAIGTYTVQTLPDFYIMGPTGVLTIGSIGPTTLPVELLKTDRTDYMALQEVTFRGTIPTTGNDIATMCPTNTYTINFGDTPFPTPIKTNLNKAKTGCEYLVYKTYTFPKTYTVKLQKNDGTLLKSITVVAKPIPGYGNSSCSIDNFVVSAGYENSRDVLTQYSKLMSSNPGHKVSCSLDGKVLMKN